MRTFDPIVADARALAAALHQRAIQHPNGNSPLLRETAQRLWRTIDALSVPARPAPTVMDPRREAASLTEARPRPRHPGTALAGPASGQ